MKRFFPVLAMLGLAGALAFGASPASMSVQVRKAEVRTTPSFLGTMVGALNYADHVTVQEQRGAWLRVAAAGGLAGWVHSSAVTKQTIVMTAGETVGTGASSSEVALAGKGFNADVEAQFKTAHKDIDFSWVDRMEKMKVSTAQVQAFVKDGGLNPR